MLLKRVAVAAGGLPLALAAVYFGGWWFFLLIAAALTLALVEYLRLLRLKVEGVEGPVAYAGLALALLGAFLGGERWALAAPALVFMLLVFRQVLRRVPGNPLGLAATYFAWLHSGWLGSFFLLLRGLPGGLFYTLFALSVTWAFDTAAYFVGGAWGRHKICPALSPGKSAEGLFAGLAGALLVAWGLGALGPGLCGGPAPGVARSLLWGLAVAVAAQVGDLAESMVKRFTGVKDSGGLLPGHGGVLDRLDSVMFAAPVMYLLVR
ncbi:MAG: phosphatidate cytidylyltransferase [Acetobacteraceae bacterium]|nr:phosphatidate cytidylyltransferase [Acetobacteraceae bacterium]